MEGNEIVIPLESFSQLTKVRLKRHRFRIEIIKNVLSDLAPWFLQFSLVVEIMMEHGPPQLCLIIRRPFRNSVTGLFPSRLASLSFDLFGYAHLKLNIRRYSFIE